MKLFIQLAEKIPGNTDITRITMTLSPATESVCWIGDRIYVDDVSTLRINQPIESVKLVRSVVGTMNTTEVDIQNETRVSVNDW